jgi:signal transduction histidine kinase
MSPAEPSVRGRVRFPGLLLQAPPWQAVLEATALAGLAMVGLLSLRAHFRPSAMSQGALFFGGGAALWSASRSSLPAQPQPLRRLAREALIAVGLSVLLAGGLGLASWLGWLVIPPESSPGVIILLLLASGPEFLVVRAGIVLWQRWASLRRRRLLWALTHMQVQVVLLFSALLGVLFVLTLVVEGYLPCNTPGSGGVVSLLDTLIFTILPFAGVAVVATVIALAALLPPTALFAYLLSRRTTRRLEDLANAAGRLRAGDYSTRVAVQGQDEIAQLQSDFNTMAEGLQEAMLDLQRERDKVAALLQSRRELVASVSHELRTPVATVRGYLDSLKPSGNEELSQELQHDLQIIEHEVVRLQTLIDDLFALSRADAGGLELDIQPTDVGALVQRQVESMAPIAWRSRRVEVIADVTQDLPPALVDERRMEQVLINLLRNGIQHTMPGGIVGVSVAVEDQAIRFDVRDTGEGIAAEDLPHIWDRYYRGKQSEQVESSGAGLGLALVKELIEAMGGTVAVESAVGEGSRFTVRVPLGR